MATKQSASTHGPRLVCASVLEAGASRFRATGPAMGRGARWLVRGGIARRGMRVSGGHPAGSTETDTMGGDDDLSLRRRYALREEVGPVRCERAIRRKATDKIARCVSAYGERARRSA